MKKWFDNIYTILAGPDLWKEAFNTGCSEFQNGDLENAETCFRRSLAALDQENPADGRLFSTLVCLGTCLRAQENSAQAEEFLRKAVAISSSASRVRAGDTAYAAKELGLCLYDLGKYPEVEVYLLQAVSLYEQSAESSHSQQDIADCCFILARTYLFQSKFEESMPLLQRSLDIFKSSKSDRIGEIADAYQCQAIAWNRTGEYKLAEEVLLSAMPLQRKIHGKASTIFARCHMELAASILSQERYTEAETIFRDALGLLATLGLEKTSDYADGLSGLAACARARKHYADAEDLYEEALIIYQHHTDNNADDIATVLTQLAVCHSEKREFAPAEEFLKKAVSVVEQALGPDHWALSENLYNLANCYSFQNRPLEAVDLYKRALDIAEAKFGNEHPTVAYRLNGLAYCYQLQNRYSEAKPLYQRALSICECDRFCEANQLADNLVGLANCHLGLGDHSAARPLYERALSCKQNKFDPKDQELAARIESLLQDLERAQTTV